MTSQIQQIQIQQIAKIAKQLRQSNSQKDKALAACLFAAIASYEDDEIMGLLSTISDFAKERNLV